MVTLRIEPHVRPLTVWRNYFYCSISSPPSPKKRSGWRSKKARRPAAPTGSLEQAGQSRETPAHGRRCCALLLALHPLPGDDGAVIDLAQLIGVGDAQRPHEATGGLAAGGSNPVRPGSGCRAHSRQRSWARCSKSILDALRFYQRPGFRLQALRPGAVDLIELRQHTRGATRCPCSAAQRSYCKDTSTLVVAHPPRSTSRSPVLSSR
jgi:hypothetical protein